MRLSDHRLLVLPLTVALVACGSPTDTDIRRTDCERLREHLVELRMETVTAEHDRFRESIRASLGGVFANCVESMSPTELRCSLAADDFDALASCNVGGES